jgi:GNAT superfamily N-acetyltransferase
VRGGGGAAGEHAGGDLSGESAIRLRRGRADDVEVIVAMQADDPLGAAREDLSLPLAECYGHALADIETDPNRLLAVAEVEGEVAGALQITFIPGLSRRGALRGQVEAVRVASGHRWLRPGRLMIERAIAECRARGCTIVQLTTDRSRSRAHAFYESLGFAPSHVGYTLTL